MAKEVKKLQVVCPCCQATLTLEPSTGMVLKTQEKKIDYSLEGALKQERSRKEKADELFAQAFQNEKKRHATLEEKFRKALDSKDELEDPTRPWDFD